MFILVLWQGRSLVTASKQGVVLSRLFATDTHLTRLQRLQGREGDTEALGSHGRSSRLQVLVPTGAKAQQCLYWLKSQHSRQNQGKLGKNN